MTMCTPAQAILSGLMVTQGGLQHCLQEHSGVEAPKGLSSMDSLSRKSYPKVALVIINDWN